MKPIGMSAFATTLFTAACSLNNNGIIDIIFSETHTDPNNVTDTEPATDTGSGQSTDSEVSTDTAAEGTCLTPLRFNRLAEERAPGVYQVEGDMPSRPSAYSGSCSLPPYAGPELVYVLESPMDGLVKIDLKGEDPLLYIRSACDDESTEIICNDDFTSTDSTVYLQVTADTTYYLFADTFSEADASPFVLTVDTHPDMSQLDIPDGVWVSPGYGLAINSTDGHIEWFETTDLSCLLLMSGALQNFGSFITQSELRDDDKLALWFSGGLVPALFDRIDALPCSCAGGGLPMIGDEGYERDPLAFFDIFAATFDDHYSAFDLKAVDWGEITAAFRAEVSEGMSDEALFDVFAEMIQPLEDYHVYIADGETSVEADIPPAIEMFIEELGGEDDTLFEYLFEQLELMTENTLSYLVDSPGGDIEVFAWGHLDSNVGYLRIMDFDSGVDDYLAMIEAALGDLMDTETLVIDMRINFGGGDELGLITAAHFIEEHVDLITINTRFKETFTEPQVVGIDPMGERYPGEVIVMISENTASAAESFTLFMRALPQVTLFGESTMGIISTRINRTLPNGWTFGVPDQYYRTLEGERFDAVGIPPKVEATPMVSGLEDRLAGIDVGLEALLSWLQDRR